MRKLTLLTYMRNFGLSGRKVKAIAAMILGRAHRIINKRQLVIIMNDEKIVHLMSVLPIIAKLMPLKAKKIAQHLGWFLLC